MVEFCQGRREHLLGDFAVEEDIQRGAEQESKKMEVKSELTSRIAVDRSSRTFRRCISKCVADLASHIIVGRTKEGQQVIVRHALVRRVS